MSIEAMERQGDGGRSLALISMASSWAGRARASMTRVLPHVRLALTASLSLITTMPDQPPKKLIVVGDSATLGGHPFYAALLEYFQATGSYHSVWEQAY